MTENTKIEWATHTMNPWMGCTKISAGCDNCYAEAMMDKRYGRVTWGPHGERVRTSEANWKLPLRWARKAHETGTRPRVFCASLADVFDNQVPARWRWDLFQLINQTPELDWLLLTKRPENVSKMLLEIVTGFLWPWPNIWLGFTAEDQEAFDRRWPIIREIPAAVRFCSYEPAIGPLRLPPYAGEDGLHWLICGGESGPGFRYMDLAWAKEIEQDCASAGVAFFMKQLAGKKPFPPEFRVVRQFPMTTD